MGPSYQPPAPYEEEMSQLDVTSRQWEIQCGEAEVEHRLLGRYEALDFHRVIELGEMEDFVNDPDRRKSLAPSDIGIRKQINAQWGELNMFGVKFYSKLSEGRSGEPADTEVFSPEGANEGWLRRTLRLPTPN